MFLLEDKYGNLSMIGTYVLNFEGSSVKEMIYTMEGNRNRSLYCDKSHIII